MVGIDMTLLLHGAISALVTLPFTNDWRVLGIAALIGMMNDLLRVIFREKDWGGTYLMLHNPKEYIYQNCAPAWQKWVIYGLLIIVYPLGLHAVMDWYWHKQEGGWYWWGIYGEAVIWLLLIGVLYATL